MAPKAGQKLAAPVFCWLFFRRVFFCFPSIFTKQRMGRMMRMPTAMEMDQAHTIEARRWAQLVEWAGQEEARFSRSWLGRAP